MFIVDTDSHRRKETIAFPKLRVPKEDSCRCCWFRTKKSLSSNVPFGMSSILQIFAAKNHVITSSHDTSKGYWSSDSAKTQVTWSRKNLRRRQRVTCSGAKVYHKKDGGSPPRNEQQVCTVKMDGWKTIVSFLGWPIFRGKLLVSGSVDIHEQKCYTPENEHSDCWKIPIFNRKYIASFMLEKFLWHSGYAGYLQPITIGWVCVVRILQVLQRLLP